MRTECGEVQSCQMGSADILRCGVYVLEGCTCLGQFNSWPVSRCTWIERTAWPACLLNHETRIVAAKRGGERGRGGEAIATAFALSG